MSTLTAQLINSSHYQNDLFFLQVKQKDTTTNITMKLFTSILNTRSIPATYSILKDKLPSILASKCFNSNNYPFSKEVKQTEIGHLFEHILLEYLCKLKRLEGYEDPVHNGLTSWNWQTDEKGVFYITIDIGDKEKVVFEKALKKCIFLTTRILQNIQSSNPIYALA